MFFNPKTSGDWVALGIIAAIVLVLGSNQLVRFPENQARSHAGHARAEMKALEKNLNTMIEAGQQLPALQPLSDFIDAKALTKSRGESLRTFGAGAHFAEHPDVFSPKGKAPFAAETSGTMYLVFASGPDYVYDIQPAVAQTAFREKSALVLGALTYDPTNGSVSPGDIFMTNFTAASKGPNSK
ncbi:hypothetical protein BH09SUM1_BH09SUM1_10890 [soil metagenome]